MLNSVLQHLKEILTGTTSAYLGPLQVAVMAPPVFADLSDPWAFIWSGTSEEHQQTMPRTMGGIPGGYQKQTWELEIALTCVLTLTTQNREMAFPALYDQVYRVLNTTPIPIIITDPATGQKSQILTIGVNVRSDIASAAATGDEGQSFVKFGATIVCSVEEKVDWSGGAVT